MRFSAIDFRYIREIRPFGTLLRDITRRFHIKPIIKIVRVPTATLTKQKLYSIDRRQRLVYIFSCFIFHRTLRCLFFFFSKRPSSSYRSYSRSPLTYCIPPINFNNQYPVSLFLSYQKYSSYTIIGRPLAYSPCTAFWLKIWFSPCGVNQRTFFSQCSITSARTTKKTPWDIANICGIFDFDEIVVCLFFSSFIRFPKFSMT